MVSVRVSNSEVARRPRDPVHGRLSGLAMAYKLTESAQTRWRAVNAPHLVALVRAGVKFEKGVMVERSDELNGEVAA
jgi:hypothetical protein